MVGGNGDEATAAGVAAEVDGCGVPLVVVDGGVCEDGVEGRGVVGIGEDADAEGCVADVVADGEREVLQRVDVEVGKDGVVVDVGVVCVAVEIE